ncbi:MAG TPA: hypothetical protein VMG32_14425 [Anaeromyxobacteraceae bacterium]|nr:hypothetical protein [Anaeromyxobacteraceae bacterium]
MDRMVFMARAMALLALGGLMASCGTDTVPFPSQDCCVASTYYICTDAEGAGRCRSYPYDTSLCSKQSTPCPADGGP